MRTIGCIYGTVTNVKDDVITISVGPDRVHLVFARGAIANGEDVAVENTMDGGAMKNEAETVFVIEIKAAQGFLRRFCMAYS